MHQRKNETSAHLDNDLRQLTYATAAKRKLQMEQEENGGLPASSSASSVISHPLITTTSGNKKRSKAAKAKQTPSSLATTLSQVHLGAVQPLHASALVPPSDHQIDLDTTSLDSLMQSQNQNFLMQLYGLVLLDIYDKYYTLTNFYKYLYYFSNSTFELLHNIYWNIWLELKIIESQFNTEKSLKS